MSRDPGRFDGVSRENLIAMLIACESELAHVEDQRHTTQRLYNMMLENLTATQRRSTQLLDHARHLQRIVDADPLRAKVLAEVHHERKCQDAKFGNLLARIDVPDHDPLAVGEWPEILAEVRESVRQHCEETGRQTCCFAHVLGEEATEALAETDPEKLRVELVQVAAVAVLWIEVLDVRRDRLESGAFV